MATHYPIINFPGFHFLKMYQSTSYVIGVETDNELFSGMYITSGSPSLSLKTVKDGEKRILLVGGSDHKTGANDVDMDIRYKLLEDYIKTVYPDAKVKYKWNTEDCISLDKVPYIGQFSTLMPNVYVATGFKKWGITTSHISAQIITDEILNKENAYKDIFSSTRFNPIDNIKEFGNMVKQTVYSLVINKMTLPENFIENLELDSGGIVDYNGKKLGVYKDKKGNLYAVEPYCKHLGCELSWNNLEKTWDCPCHGSRYTYEGDIIKEPTKKNLNKVKIN